MGRGPLAFAGCMGQCASTHNLHAMDCPREVRALWRALLFPSEERADGPQGADSAGAQHPAAWRASLFLLQKKPSFVPDSKAFNSNIGEGFLVPQLKGECEASEDEKADSSSAHNVGNGVLFAIGLHGSGDAVALCQELYEVERRSICVDRSAYDD